MAKKITNVYEVNGNYYLDYIHPITKQRIRKSAHTTIKEKALELYNKEYSEAYNQILGKNTSKTVRELIDWCWENYWGMKRGADKNVRYVAMKTFLDYFGEHKAMGVTADMLREFMRMRIEKVKKRTVQLEFTHVSCAYNQAIRNSLLRENPFKRIDRDLFVEDDHNGEKGRTRIATPQEIELLLGHSAGMLNKIIEFDLNCGLRKGQIENLRWADVDFINRTMTTGTGKGKRYHTYKVPLFDRALEILKSLPQDTEYVFTGPYGAKIPENGLIHAGFPRLTKRIQLADFIFHDLRHTFATDYYRKTKDLKAIQHILGHTNSKTTEIYLNLNDADLVPADGYRFATLRHKNDTGEKTENEKTLESVENQ